MALLDQKADQIIEQKQIKRREEAKKQLADEYKYRRELEKRTIRQKIEMLKEEASRIGLPIKDRNQPEIKFDKSLKDRTPEEIEQERLKTIAEANKATEANKQPSTHDSNAAQEADQNATDGKSHIEATERDSQEFEHSPTLKSQSNLADREEKDRSPGSNRLSQASSRSKVTSNSRMRRREEIDRELSELYKQEDKLDLTISKRSSRKLDYSDTTQVFDFEAEKQLMNQQSAKAGNSDSQNPKPQTDPTKDKPAETNKPSNNAMLVLDKPQPNSLDNNPRTLPNQLETSPKSPGNRSRPSEELKQPQMPANTGTEANLVQEDKASNEKDFFSSDPVPTEVAAPKGPAFMKPVQKKPSTLSGSKSSIKANPVIPAPKQSSMVQDLKTRDGEALRGQPAKNSAQESNESKDPFASNDDDEQRVTSKPVPVAKQPTKPQTIREDKQVEAKNHDEDFDSFDNGSSLSKPVVNKISAANDPFNFVAPEPAKNKQLTIKESKPADDDDDEQFFAGIGKSDNKALDAQPPKPATGLNRNTDEYPKFDLEMDRDDDF